jgi:hypothetical protein
MSPNSFYVEANVNNKHIDIYGPYSKEAAFDFIVKDLLSCLKQKHASSFFLSSLLYYLDENQNKIVFLKRNLSRINNEKPQR